MMRSENHVTKNREPRVNMLGAAIQFAIQGHLTALKPELVAVERF
jgi:hypothetical protein